MRSASFYETIRLTADVRVTLGDLALFLDERSVELEGERRIVPFTVE